MLAAVPLVLALAPAVPQAARPAAAAAHDDGPSPFLYYDWVDEHGVLRGGRVPIDPANPLHVDLSDPGAAERGAAAPVTTLVDNGPPANRIDLVFVGDGYTAGELGQYAADVDAIWPAFLAEPPLATYASYFNVHRVDVTSPESGVDHDPRGVFRDTALDMTYWCGGTERLLCVDVGKALTQAAAAPGRDCVLALANSTRYGGAGYDALGTIAGRNGAAIEIGLHEFGHSFARLADEYDYGGSTTYDGPEPSQSNVSTHTAAELLALDHKWRLWLDLPHVDAFEGAMYSRFGIYRPTFDSKMRSLGRPFQEVNAERFVRHVYRFVDPIDDATPAGRYPFDAVFFVDPIDPVGHALDVQWSLDGAPIPGATGPTFDAATLGLRFGPHALSVTVVDPTPLVRGPGIRDMHLTETRTWTLSNGLKAKPFAGPVTPAAPRLTLEAAPTAGGPPVLVVESELEGVPLVLVDSPLAPRAVWRGVRVAPGVPARIPLAASSAGGSLRVRVALVAPAAGGRRLLWSDALELVPAR